MIAGTVTGDREIVIPLDVFSGHQLSVSIAAVVDTGFNGYLTLPLQTLNELEAVSAGTRRAELGDGNIVEMDVYLVNVKWRAAEREVLALRSEATPLIGMAMLWGSRVAFDAKKGGAVSIDAIP
ncbi:MAG: clan AA aspartic protease [Planctomycetaceae bacterium]